MVVTHSSGNHGQAVAWAARQLGLPCTVVVPEGTPAVKCQAIQVREPCTVVVPEGTPAVKCQAIQVSLAQWFLSGDTRGIFYCIIFTCLKLFYITVSYWMGDLLAMHTNNSQLVEAKTDSLRQHLHVNMCCTLHSGQSKGWRSVKCQAYRWNLSTK